MEAPKPDPAIAVANDALFGSADELAFRRQFVTQFLASYCASNFNDYCARGMQDLLETPPVEDAAFLSLAAWQHWCATMEPNAKAQIRKYENGCGSTECCGSIQEIIWREGDSPNDQAQLRPKP